MLVHAQHTVPAQHEVSLLPQDCRRAQYEAALLGATRDAPLHQAALLGRLLAGYPLAALRLGGDHEGIGAVAGVEGAGGVALEGGELGAHLLHDERHTARVATEAGVVQVDAACFHGEQGAYQGLGLAHLHSRASR